MSKVYENKSISSNIISSNLKNSSTYKDNNINSLKNSKDNLQLYKKS